MVVVMICQKAEAKSSRMQVELYWHSINKSVSPLTNLRVGAVLLREQIQKSHRIGADCLCWCVPHAIVVAERVGKHCLGMFGGGDFNCQKIPTLAGAPSHQIVPRKRKISITCMSSTNSR